jgi:hypothetical protein
LTTDNHAAPMTQLKTDVQDEFLPKDLRGQLRAWIREKDLDSRDYVKPEVAIYRLTEELSLNLNRREKYGHGFFSLYRSWAYEEIRDCGKTGEFQKNKRTGELRAIGHYCNHRRFHIPCAQRFRRGQAVEMRSAYMEIVKSKKLWGLWHWTFTMPYHVRAWIEKSEKKEAILKDARRAVSKTIKEVLGVNTKVRNIQPGYSILYHPVSSGNPFKPSPHFHTIILPLVVNLKTRSETKFKKQFTHTALKQSYKKHFDQVLEKYQVPYDLSGQYVIHMRYIDARDPRAVDHLFFYNNRSQVDDVLKSIKRVHAMFDNFLCVLWNKKNEVYHPVIKDQAELLDALEFILNPLINIRLSYGFMRTIDRYSGALGIERDEYEQSDDWETLYKINIRRDMVKVWDEDAGRVKPLTSVFIKRSDSPEAWRKIKPDELHGERVCLSGRKFYKAVGYGSANSRIIKQSP